MGAGHIELGTGGIVVVILAHCQLAHVAGGELRADAAQTQQVANPTGNGQQGIGNGYKALTVMACLSLKAVKLFECKVLTREEIAAAMLTHSEGIDDGGGGIGHVDKTFAPAGSNHQGFAVAGKQQGTRTGLGVEGANHETGIYHYEMPAGVLPGSVQQDIFALPLAESIVGTAEGGLHGLQLVGRVRGGAVAYGVGGAGVYQTRDILPLHKFHQPLAQVAVHREVVVVPQERHIGCAGTIDNGVATLGCGVEGGIVEQGPFQH